VTVTGGLDALLYSEALEQQWALVHDIMAPGGAWLAFVDRTNLAEARAIGKGERDLAGFVAATIAHAQPFFWRASIARALVSAVQTLPDYTFTAESFPCQRGVRMVRGADSARARGATPCAVARLGLVSPEPPPGPRGRACPDLRVRQRRASPGWCARDQWHDPSRLDASREPRTTRQ
jgi:hypothetical protein